MKILYISYEHPYFPGGTGGQTRQYHLVKQLSYKHDFHYIGPKVDNDATSKLNEIFQRVSLPKVNLYNRFISSAIKRIPHGYPRFVKQFEGQRWLVQPILSQALARSNYDLIHVEHTNIAHWLHNQFTNTPKIIVAQNVKSIMWERYYRLASGAEQKKLYQDYLKFIKYEQKYLMDYNGIVAMSNIDRNIIQETYNIMTPIFVVPNGVDIDYFNVKDDAVEPSTIVFTGSMNHPPNNEAMLFFCRKILPHIRKSRPSTKLFIVGSSPSQDVKILHDNKHIFVTGFVNDTRSYIASASVVVVPLLSGSGTRLKIMEAMAMGKAIVSTSIGAEGIEYVNGKHIMIADDEKNFADTVVDLLDNPIKGLAIGANARKLVVEKYSWKQLAVVLETVYESILAQHARCPLNI